MRCLVPHSSCFCYCPIRVDLRHAVRAVTPFSRANNKHWGAGLIEVEYRNSATISFGLLLCLLDYFVESVCEFGHHAILQNGGTKPPSC